MAPWVGDPSRQPRKQVPLSLYVKTPIAALQTWGLGVCWTKTATPQTFDFKQEDEAEFWGALVEEQDGAGGSSSPGDALPLL